MTDQEILDKVVAVIARHSRVSPESLGAGTSINSLGIGSLDMVQILFDIEEAFDIYVTEDGREMQALTIGDMCVQVRRLRASAKPTV